MNVLKISQAYYPFLETGGPPTKVRALARRLAAKGHRVTVLTADLGLGEAGIPAVATVTVRDRHESTEDGIETIYLPTLARYRSLTWNTGVRAFCQESLKGFDVVHIYGLYDLLGPAVARRCRRLQIPYLVEPMGMYRPIVRNVHLKRLYHRMLGASLVRGAAMLIATSEQEKHELEEGDIAPEKIFVRSNGVEVPDSLPTGGEFRRRWAIAPEDKLVLFLGRLTAKKNPDVALAAFARWHACSGRPPACLVLAGPPDERSVFRKLKETAGQLGLRDAVRFIGPLFGEEKWLAYCDADVFVLPSQNENFGNAAAEAAACGTPVIVTDQCGIARMVEGRAGLVVACGVEPLANALAELLDDPHLRERYRRGCDAMTRQLSWDEPVSQMEELYQRAGADRP